MKDVTYNSSQSHTNFSSSSSTGHSEQEKNKHALIDKILLCSYHLQLTPSLSSHKPLPSQKGLLLIDTSLRSLSIYNSLLLSSQMHSLSQLLDHSEISSLSFSAVYLPPHLPKLLTKPFQKIQTLSIEKNILNKKFLKTLLRALPKLKSLKLSDNALKDLHMFSFSTTKTQLQTLHIEKQLFTRKAFSYFVNFCKKNPQLTELSLPHNSITGDILHSISKALEKLPKLTKIDLSWNQINDKELGCLSVALSRFQWKELSLAGNSISSLSFLQKDLEKNTSLKLLNLDDNAFDDESLKALLKLGKKSLTILMRNNHSLTSQGQSFLINEQKKGFFSDMDISSKINVLEEKKEKKFPHLLQLSKQNISGFCIEMQKAQITSLHLEDEKIDDEQIFFLTQYLQISSQLHSLSLNENSFSKHALTNLVHGLESNTSLIRLDLKGVQKLDLHTLEKLRTILKRNEQKLIPPMHPPLPLLFESTEPMPKDLSDELMPFLHLSRYARAHQVSFNLSSIGSPAYSKASFSFCPHKKALSINDTVLYHSKAKDLGHLILLLKAESIQFKNISISNQALTELSIALKNSSCHSLSFNTCSLPKRSIQSLCQHLDTHAKLKTLSFSNITLSFEAMSSLAKILGTGKIKHLSLVKAKISTEALCSFEASFKKNTQLRSLSLEGNALPNKAMSALSKILLKSKITSLILSANQIGEEGLAILQEEDSFNYLETFDLSHNLICNNAIKQLLLITQDCPILKNISLKSNRLDKHSLDMVEYFLQKKKTRIKAFYLDDNDFSKEDIKRIRTFHNIAFLSDIKDVKEEKGPSEKDIQKAFEKNELSLLPNLLKSYRGDSLSLAFAISPDSMGLLVSYLRNNPPLLSLDIHLDTENSRAFVNSFPLNQSLLHLKIQLQKNLGKTFTDNSFLNLFKALRGNISLKTLDLSGSAIKSLPKEFLAFINESSLETLSLQHNELTDVSLSTLANSLKGNKSLTSLNLNKNKIKDIPDNFSSFIEKSSIKTLSLQHNELTETSVKTLLLLLKNNVQLSTPSSKGNKDNTSIRTLSLRNNKIKKFTNVLAPSFSKNSITTLNLYNKELTDETMSNLAKSLKDNISLKTLYLYNNKIKKFTDAFGPLFSKNSITKLYLHNNELIDEAMSNLAKSLKDNTSLKTLSLYNNKIKNFTDAFDPFFSKNSITTLYLHNNELTDKAVLNLAKSLKDNTSLKTLYLYNNKIKKFTDAFGPFFSKNSITKLYLHNNELTDEAMLNLAKSLKDNSSLRTLSLYNNKIKNFTDAFGPFFSKNSITTLNLYNNELTDKAILNLAKSLKNNTSLKTLSLYNNKIKNFTDAFGPFFSKNSITTLNLYNNELTNEAMSNLAKSLKNNTSLKNIYLYNEKLQNILSNLLNDKNIAIS